MKPRNFLILTLTIGLISGASAFKVDVCHNVDNNPHTINISLPAAISHILRHPGDSFGDCNEVNDEPTTVGTSR